MPKFSSTKGTIAAGHQQTADAGKIAYQAGGNAIDAAVAALFASCVTEPCMSGFGGGGFAMVMANGEPPEVLDFFCQTPQVKKDPAEIEFDSVEVQFSSTTEVFHVGKGAVAVPGMARGIFEMHKRFGTLPIDVLVEPAIELANNGSDVDWFQEYDYELLECIFSRSPVANSIFYRDGRRLVDGEQVFNKELADFLSELGKAGPEVFYTGFAAQQMGADFRDAGQITLDDLASYEAIWRKPLSLNRDEFKIHTNPTPSRGGIVIAQTLDALDHEERHDFKFGDSSYSGQMLYALLTGSRHAEEQYTKWGSTTHISTVDIDGNAVSASVSNGEGTGYFIPGTGIQLNNMLGEVALFPDGLHSWQPNTRVRSLMAPTILEMGSDTVIALGTGGAGRIPSAMSQVMGHLIYDRVSVQEAINRSRIHVHGRTLELEPGIQAPNTLPEEIDSANHWSKQNMFFGGVHVASNSHGTLDSAGDPRRNGMVAYSN